MSREQMRLAAARVAAWPEDRRAAHEQAARIRDYVTAMAARWSILDGCECTRCKSERGVISGNGSAEPPTCQWREEDDDGFGIANTVCGKPAAYVSCVPYVKTYTCEQHRCRCARLINGRGES